VTQSLIACPAEIFRHRPKAAQQFKIAYVILVL
jgi:hypothetical protein